jgi:hypothetical protein
MGHADYWADALENTPRCRLALLVAVTAVRDLLVRARVLFVGAMKGNRYRYVESISSGRIAGQLAMALAAVRLIFSRMASLNAKTAPWTSVRAPGAIPPSRGPPPRRRTLLRQHLLRQGQPAHVAKCIARMARAQAAAAGIADRGPPG